MWSIFPFYFKTKWQQKNICFLKEIPFKTKGHSKSTFARNFQFLTSSLLLLVPVCFTCTLCPPQRTFALVSYSPLKKSSATFMNKKYFRIKNWGEKKEKMINFLVNSTQKINVFYTVIYLQVHKKSLNKKKCLLVFDKKTTFICWTRLKTAKLLATIKQLIRKDSVCCLKNQAIFFTYRTYGQA